MVRQIKHKLLHQNHHLRMRSLWKSRCSSAPIGNPLGANTPQHRRHSADAATFASANADTAKHSLSRRSEPFRAQVSHYSYCQGISSATIASVVIINEPPDAAGCNADDIDDTALPLSLSPSV